MQRISFVISFVFHLCYRRLNTGAGLLTIRNTTLARLYLLSRKYNTLGDSLPLLMLLHSLEAMPLEPYRSYRPATPDYNEYPSPVQSNSHSRNASGSSLWSSPESTSTHATTPSPVRLQHGPTLIPKVRSQDQTIAPDYKRRKTHRRALSSNCNPPEHPRPLSRPGFQRSTTSPPECSNIITPVSATSTADLWPINSSLNSPAPYSSTSTRGSLGHGRATSQPAIDAATLRRYVNPTYRTYPVYTTRSPRYTPAPLDGVDEFVPEELSLAAPAPFRELTPELYCSYGPTTTIMNYLTGPNPAVRPVDNLSTGMGLNAHFWWDIRNLRVWEDFDLETINAIPGFSRVIFSATEESSGLLNVPVEAAALPNPPIGHAALQPPNERGLQDIINRFYAAKINAAIKTSQGARHMTMRPEHSPDNGPYFVSAYTNDLTQTLSGRGRLVGLVKSYNNWNTGMRHEKGVKQVQYLAGLAHIQRLMREHNTRYGYIITEIELICVRMGTEDGIPYFGLIEVCDPIALKNQDGLTAGLALWYLHMLTGDEPLRGQCYWKVEIGPPAQMTRSKVLPGGRDTWMQRIQEGEKRSAKTKRGWIMPEDKFNRKKENGIVRSRTVV